MAIWLIQAGSYGEYEQQSGAFYGPWAGVGAVVGALCYVTVEPKT